MYHRLVLLVVALALLTSLAVAQNLIPNGDFEQGASGWSERGGTVQIDREVRHGGEAALRMQAPADAPYLQFYTASSGKLPLLSNRLYRLRAAVKTGVRAELRFRQSDASGKELGWTGITGVLPGGEWQTVENVFWTLPGTASGQLLMILRNETGPVWFDDLSLELLPEVKPWQQGAGQAVDFRGRPSAFGMKIESCDLGLDRQSLTVTTTGGQFVYSAKTGQLALVQRIGKSQVRAVATLPPTEAKLRLVREDADRVIATTGTLDLGFHGDSMVFISGPAGTQVTVARRFEPKFSGWREGFLTAIDDTGGMCAWPSYQRGTGLSTSYTFTSTGPAELPETITYTLQPGGRLALSVFPPREFDWAKSFDWQIMHTGGYPPDSVIESWSKIANLLVLHETIWQTGVPLIFSEYRAVDEAELKRCIAAAHRFGMKVLPYFSSDFHADQYGDGFMNSVAAAKQKYGFDGVYYDQLPWDYWERAYEVMRQTRELVGDGPIYLHNSPAPPFHRQYPNVFLPQLDAYADFILKGEGIPINGWDDPYLRYVARGYNVSNAIGTLKFDKMVVNGKAPTNLEVLDPLLALNMRQRMAAYPGAQGYPTVEKLDPAWPALHRKILELKAKHAAAGGL